MIVAVTVYASVWSILINTIDGVRNIERTLIDTGRTFGLSTLAYPVANHSARRLALYRHRSAYRLSIALILVTTAEMIAGSKGLGFYILDEERSMNSSNMYAGHPGCCGAGLRAQSTLPAAEARVMKWRHGMMARETA